MKESEYYKGLETEKEEEEEMNKGKSKGRGKRIRWKNGGERKAEQ